MDKPTTIAGGEATDDRGSLSFVNSFDFKEAGIRRFYQVENHRAGFVRAFHGHKRESKYAFVPRGAVHFCAVDLVEYERIKVGLENDGPDYQRGVAVNFKTGQQGWDAGSHAAMEVGKQIFNMSSRSPGLLFIPAGYSHGFKTLTSDTIVQFFSTSSLGESNNDDVRHPWDYFYNWQENPR